MQTGLSTSAERLTVDAYLTSWLEGTAANRVRPATYRSYRDHIENHLIPAFKGIRLRDLSSAHIDSMLAGVIRKGLSPTTANRVRATLRTALEGAVRADMVVRNVAKLSTARRETSHRVSPPTQDELRSLLRYVQKDRMGPLIEVAVYTGMRQGELLALVRSDVDLDRGVIHFRRTLTWVAGNEDQPARVPVFSDPKTDKSRRWIKLAVPAIAALRRQREQNAEMEMLSGDLWRRQQSNRKRQDEAESPTYLEPHSYDLVFPSVNGNPPNSSNVTHRLQSLLKAAGLPRYRFHDLRHATASLLLAEGLDLFTVKEILGHGQISLTANTYGHMTDRLSDAAVRGLERSLADDKTGDLTTKVTTEAIAPDDTDDNE
jgi:integrase